MELEEEIKNTQVIILAGGSGKRMSDSNLPKALQRVANKELIDRCIEHYAKHGFKDFIILVGYLHEAVESHVGDGSKYGVSIRYCVDPEGVKKVGKGKALKNAIQTGKVDLNKRAIITYPDDIFLEEDLPVKLLEKHLEIKESKGTIATIVCVSGTEYPYGVVLSYDGDVVNEFFEKPLVQIPTNTGTLAVEPEFYKMVEENVEMDREEAIEFEKSVLPKVIKAGKLNRVLIKVGTWIPVNTQKELEDAEKMLLNKQ